MARIVLGVAASHSPQLSTPAELWRLHAERDRGNKDLNFRGTVYSFAELSEVRAGEHIADEISDEKWMAKYQGCERAIAALHAAVEQVKPDVMVIVGDDQRELFSPDQMPALAIYWGQEIECVPKAVEELPPSLAPARWANYGEQREMYPCEATLGRHLVKELTAGGFDVMQLRTQPAGHSVGHAYNFIRNRVMEPKSTPMVPVLLNTYFPPNQPSPARCYDLGRTLRQAIEGWDSDKTVCIAASGGLSHFVVDEALDRDVIAGIEAGGRERLAAIAPALLDSGSSEIRNWICAAGALEGLGAKVLDYIPAYRTPAGTGCGMGFAVWRA